MSQIADPSAGLAGDDRIVLSGIVDGVVGERLGLLVAERLAGGTSQVALDLSGVEAIDENGLVAIVRIWHETSTSGRSLSLLDPSPAVGPLLAMTGLTATVTAPVDDVLVDDPTATAPADTHR